MKLISKQDEQCLVGNLKKVCLLGQPNVLPYEHCSLFLETVHPTSIVIPQDYVLGKNLADIATLRNILLCDGVDILRLNGYVTVETDDGNGGVILRDVLPPVVEQSGADGGAILLNDGMHRMYLAWMLDLPITVVKIYGVSQNTPYYAMPLNIGFKDVMVIPGAVKIFEGKEFEGKAYRLPGKEYKKLFRDFNSAFENVTFSRKK